MLSEREREREREFGLLLCFLALEYTLSEMVDLDIKKSDVMCMMSMHV